MVKANCPRDKSVDVSICYLLREHLSVGITCRADNRVLAFISFGLSRFFTTPACILSPIYSTFVINSQSPRQGSPDPGRGASPPAPPLSLACKRATMLYLFYRA